MNYERVKRLFYTTLVQFQKTTRRIILRLVARKPKPSCVERRFLVLVIWTNESLEHPVHFFVYSTKLCWKNQENYWHIIDIYKHTESRNCLIETRYSDFQRYNHVTFLVSVIKWKNCIPLRKGDRRHEPTSRYCCVRGKWQREDYARA